MNKVEMADRLASRTGLNKAAARDVVDSMFATTGEALANGEEVRVAGFGTFAARIRPARTGRNPKTGELISISVSKSPSFKAGKAIRDAVNGGRTHLWEFEIDGRCYGDPSFREFGDEPPVYRAKSLRLGAVIARGVDRFVYTYEYGDNWRHDVIVEEVRDGDGRL